MRREKARHPLSFLLLKTVERLEKRDHLARIVAVGQAILDAQFVGFQFVFAAVAKKNELRGHAAEIENICRKAQRLTEDRAAKQEPLTDLLLKCLARRVPRGDVAEFV